VVSKTPKVPPVPWRDGLQGLISNLIAIGLAFFAVWQSSGFEYKASKSLAGILRTVKGDPNLTIPWVPGLDTSVVGKAAERAYGAYERRRPDSAVAVLDTIATTWGLTNPNHLLLRALVRRQLHDLPGGMQDLQRVVELDPSYAVAHSYTGIFTGESALTVEDGGDRRAARPLWKKSKAGYVAALAVRGKKGLDEAGRLKTESWLFGTRDMLDEDDRPSDFTIILFAGLSLVLVCLYILPLVFSHRHRS
jgi:hypothetical protein